MSEFKGTPGPWVASEDWVNHECITIYSDTGIQPHVCYTPEFTCDDEIANANACLIAAAPALLEALEGVCEHFDWSTKIQKDAWYKAKQAIDKALGRGKSC